MRMYPGRKNEKEAVEGRKVWHFVGLSSRGLRKTEEGWLEPTELATPCVFQVQMGLREGRSEYQEGQR